MLVSRKEIKEVLEVGDKTIIANYLKSFTMQRVSCVSCYDVNYDFLLRLRRVIMQYFYNSPYVADNCIHRHSLDIINQVIEEWEQPIDEFVITSDDIRDLFPVTLAKCEKLLSGSLDKFKVRKLPKTYKCTKEFLDKLAARAESLDINLGNSLKQLYKLVLPNTAISHKIHHWTTDMLMCKARGCNCEGCFFENFFTPYDPNFSLIVQSPKTCNIKGYVHYAIEHCISESKVSPDCDEDSHTDEE